MLDGVLEKQEWLVGGKLTVADLAFVTWNDQMFWRKAVDSLPEKVDFAEEFPAFWRYVCRLLGFTYGSLII